MQLIPLRAEVEIPVDLKLVSVNSYYFLLLIALGSEFSQFVLLIVKQVKLQNSKYRSRRDFLYDMKKMFSNVKTYLPTEDGLLFMLSSLEEDFYRKYHKTFGRKDGDESSDDDNLFEAVTISKAQWKAMEAKKSKLANDKNKQANTSVTSLNLDEEGLVNDGEIPGPSSQITQSLRGASGNGTGLSSGNVSMNAIAIDGQADVVISPNVTNEDTNSEPQPPSLPIVSSQRKGRRVPVSKQSEKVPIAKRSGKVPVAKRSGKLPPMPGLTQSCSDTIINQSEQDNMSMESANGKSIKK